MSYLHVHTFILHLGNYILLSILRCLLHQFLIINVCSADDAGRLNKLCHFVAEHVYCTETRPYNQGARLTAYELVHDKIPATLVCDSMVSALMRARNITAVVVGADRVATNGDTANKIGTYQVLC